MFQRDPLFRGALRLNLLTEQIDIVKPLGWAVSYTHLDVYKRQPLDCKASICIAKLIKIARMATIAVSIRRLLLLVR